MKKITEELTDFFASIMDQIKFFKSSPDKKVSPKAQDPTTAVPANKNSPPLKHIYSEKLVASVISNMRSAHQNDMNSSSRQNSKATLLWNSINYTTTSRYVSMR